LVFMYKIINKTVVLKIIKQYVQYFNRINKLIIYILLCTSKLKFNDKIKNLKIKMNGTE